MRWARGVLVVNAHLISMSKQGRIVDIETPNYIIKMKKNRKLSELYQANPRYVTIVAD